MFFPPCLGVAFTPYLHFEVTGQGPLSKKCLQGRTRPLPLWWKWAEHGSVGEPTAETRSSRRDSNRLLGRPRRERVIEWWAGHREHVLGGTPVEGHQNLDQASDQVERPALCRVIPPREEGCGCQKLGPQVPSSGSTKGGIRLRRKYKIPNHCLNRVFGHYGLVKSSRLALSQRRGRGFESLHLHQRSMSEA
jgi:hypothetical protein